MKTKRKTRPDRRSAQSGARSAAKAQKPVQDSKTSPPPAPPQGVAQPATKVANRSASMGKQRMIGKQQQYAMAHIGFRFLAEGKLDSAGKVFNGLAALDPEDAYFQLALGSVAQREGRLEEAERRYSRSLEIDPHSVPALANRGEVRALVGNAVGALADFDRAQILDPEARNPASRLIKASRIALEKRTGARKATPWRSHISNGILKPQPPSDSVTTRASEISQRLAKVDPGPGPGSSIPAPPLTRNPATGVERRVGGARARVRKFKK